MKTIICGIVLFSILLFSNYSTQAAEKAYHIGPGDVLEISVWKDPELSRKLIVPPDGIISFPLIGSIDVSRIDIPTLKEIVTQKLSEFIPDATVTVMIIEINSLKAYVIGKVKNPGEFVINLDTRVMQILSKAGGLTPFASRSNIQILRQKSNKIIKIPFDYGEVEKGKNVVQNIIVKSGDVVIVP